ncbi:MAG: hypothetical protein IKE08_00425 [Clostridia bacterium]|nr:hypothetical protein [Clostridia bacterium]
MYFTKNRIPVLLIALLLLLTAIPVMTVADSGTIEIPITNTPVKGLIQVEKQGPVLTGFNEHQDPFGNLVYSPIYGTGYLEGAVFEIRAVEDIVGKDGTVWFKAGELADTIITTSEKTDQSKLLPLGHYYVTEVSAPDGYAFDSTRYDVVLEARDHETPVVTVTLTASNELMPSRISLQKQKEVLKTDADAEGMVRTTLTAEPGEGFVFGLFCKDQLTSTSGSLTAGTLMATAISGKDGAVSFYGRFPAGGYEIRELSGPEGWALQTEPIGFALPGDADIKDGEMRLAIAEPVLNPLIHADVSVSKTDLTGSDYLPHTMIEIRNSNGDIVLKGYTGDDGYLPTFPAVPGAYTYREVLAPEGYELCVTELSFSISKEGRIVGKTTVADDFTRFSVRKEDEKHRPLAGVEFGLFRKDGTLQAKAVTGDDGLAVFEKIPYGQYEIRETKGLPGYLLNTTAVPITVDGTFVNPKEPVATLVNIQSEILIKKVDQNGTPLQGAEFGLYNEKGKLVMTATSDDEGLARFIGADYGKYTIRELSAPDDYLMNHEVISLTIGEGYVNSSEPAATVVTPEKKIMCIKSDPSGKPLPGVEFALYNASTMEKVETAVSDANGVFTFRKFDYGDWIIRETAAPEGYSRMEDVRFHVGDGWTAPKPILCVNIPNHYEFIKTDSSGQPLAGVKFRLEDESGKELGTYESGKDGIVRISNLKPGTYLIRETETLEGFTVTGEVIKVKLDAYYTVPEKMRQLVNYTTIQTGVHLAVTGIMWAGLGLMVVSGVVGLTRRHRRRKTG